MSRRRILMVAAAGLALVLGGLVLAAVLIPEDRVAEAVARRAEAALQQPVAIEGVGISLLPLPGVRLTGVSVGQPDSSALARLDRAELRVRLLPLLRGRVVIRSLDIERPRIVVEFDSAGVANFPVIQGDTAAEPSTRSIAFAIERLRIRDGSIRYHSRPDSALVELHGWDQELSLAGELREGELALLGLAGTLSFDDVTARLPGMVLPARDLQLRITHDATLDVAADRLVLDTLDIGFDGVFVGGSGRVEGVNSGRPTVALRLAADGLDAGRLLAWVPDSMRARLALPDGTPIGLLGSASIRAAVAGTVAPDTLPAVDGSLSLADVAVSAGPRTLLEGVDGSVAFSLDSVVARFDGRALGEGFNAGIAVRDPAAPLAVVAFSGRGDLARLQQLGLVSDTLGLAGSVRVDLRAQVPVRSPAAARAAGTIEAAGVTLAGLDPVVRVPAATARLDGGRVRITPFRVELGPDRAGIDLDITADGWIPAAVDTAAPPPAVAVVMEAGTLDLDALLGPSESGGYAPLLFARLRDRDLDGRSAEQIARDLGLHVPALPPVDARVEATIQELVRNGLHYTEMDALARVTPEAVTLERLDFRLMGGTVNLSGIVEPVALDSAGAPVETRIMGRFGLSNVGAAPFFDRLTPFRDHLAGQLDMAGSVGMTLDRYALPDRNSLEAGGTLAISEGRLANWAVLRGVADRLQLAGFDTLRFRDWAGAFRVQGPRVTLQETALQGSTLDARASGWFDLGGQLDVQAIAGLTRELAGRAGAIGEQILAASPEGRIPVGLLIRGPVENPGVSLDLDAAREAVLGRAREAAGAAAREAEARVRTAAEEAAGAARTRAEQEGQALVDQATGEATERLALPDSLRGLPADSLRKVLGDSAYALLPDSVKLRADSLQQALQNALQDRLRRLLRRGGGGGP